MYECPTCGSPKFVGPHRTATRVCATCGTLYRIDVRVGQLLVALVGATLLFLAFWFLLNHWGSAFFIGSYCAILIPVLMAKPRRVYAQGLCQRCGYNLRGGVCNRCPECGTLQNGS